MEPGHEDREYFQVPYVFKTLFRPQWSPVMKTGNTTQAEIDRLMADKPQWSPVMKTGNTPADLRWLREPQKPQWSPVMKTGNTGLVADQVRLAERASMEPGHEDREYTPRCSPSAS